MALKASAIGIALAALLSPGTSLAESDLAEDLAPQLVPVSLPEKEGRGAPVSLLEELEFRHGISFFHELKYPPGYARLDYLNPDAPKGGTFVEATPYNFDTLSPATTRGVEAPGAFAWTLDTLLFRSGDEVSAFYGRLADGIAVTDDQLTIVFRIRPEARWHDGRPITSRDVEYSIDVYLSEIVGALYWGFVESVEVIDERHVAIHLKDPMTLNNIIMLQFTSILPAHYWSIHDPTKTTMTPGLGSGPYRISSVKQGSHIEFERVDDYWARELPFNRGRYNFDRLRYDVYRDSTVIREALRKGLIDSWTEQDVRYWHAAYDIPALAKGWLKKIRRNFGIEIGVRRALALNNRREKFQDRRVRQALTLAMDFEWQNRTIHYGYQRRAHSYWPDTDLAATGLPSPEELELLEPLRDELPQELFEREFRFREVRTPADHRRNMLEARELLVEAGWRIGADGVLRNAAGEAFEMEFLSSTQADARILLPYFQELEQLGIHGRIRLVETSQYINRLREFKFDALLRNHDILLPPVIELYSYFHSSAANEPLTLNQSGIEDPALDALVVAANLGTTLEEMVAACRAIDRVMLWQYYNIPLYAVDRPRTVHWDKFGQPAFEPKYWPAYPDGWWFDPEKAARIQILD